MNRNEFLQKLMLMGGGSLLAAAQGESLDGKPVKEAASELTAEQLHTLLPHGEEKIVILLYPGFTAIDAIGPEYMLSAMAGSSVQFIAKTKEIVQTETRFGVVPDLDFSECPDDLDLILVPGGTDGLLAVLDDGETMDFLRIVGNKAKLVGSVCTGSLILAAAGLLFGYQATSHWQTQRLLPAMGIKPSKARVVHDRDRITAGGVTAGLDLALGLVKHYRGEFYAKGVQLLAQYDPQELFEGGGDPSRADREVVFLLEAMHSPYVDQLGERILELHECRHKG